MKYYPLPGIIRSTSTQGYKRNSPDVEKPFNIIDSKNLTMEGVDFPVTGVGRDGEVIQMQPGVKNYKFKKGPVTEFPTK